MKICLLERFQRDLRDLRDEEKAKCVDLLLSLPRSVGTPHLHSGMGIRKLHRSGIYEARLGLDLRVIFALRPDEVVLVTAGTHDHVQRYLKTL